MPPFSPSSPPSPTTSEPHDSDTPVPLDISTPPRPRGPLPPHHKLHHFRSPPFATAYRRIYSRRERLYRPDTPGLVAERLDVAEEAPPSPARAARTRAFGHLSRAYAAAGYAQAALVSSVSLLLAALAIALGRALYADVSRKTRVRADDIAIAAADCMLQRERNGCVADGSSVSHATPAMDELCKKWLACERRGRFADADAVSASVWAEAFAETVNAFANNISNTAVVLSLLGAIVLAFAMSSAAFGFMHRRLVDEKMDERSLTREVLDDKPWGGELAAEGKKRHRAITYDGERGGVSRRSPAR